MKIVSRLLDFLPEGRRITSTLSLLLSLYGFLIFFIIHPLYEKTKSENYLHFLWNDLFDDLVYLIFLIPPLLYLFYFYYVKNNKPSWIKVFKYIFLCGAIGGIVLFILIVEDEGLPTGFVDANGQFVYNLVDWNYFLFLLIYPFVLFYAFYDKSIAPIDLKIKKTLKIFFSLKKIVATGIIIFLIFFGVRTIQVGGIANMYERIYLSSHIIKTNLVVRFDLYDYYGSNEGSNMISGCQMLSSNFDSIIKNAGIIRSYFWTYLLEEDLIREIENYDGFATSYDDIFKLITSKDPMYKILISYAYNTGSNSLIQKDGCKALQWMMKAAHQNNKTAMALLGILYAYAIDDHKEVFGYDFLKKNSLKWLHKSGYIFKSAPVTYTFYKLINHFETEEALKRHYGLENVKTFNGSVFPPLTNFTLIEKTKRHNNSSIKILDEWYTDLNFWNANKILASEGYLPSMADMYHEYSIDTNGTPKNCSKVKEYLHKVAQKGDPMARYLLLGSYMKHNPSNKLWRENIHNCLGGIDYIKAYEALNSLKGIMHEDSFNNYKALFALNGWSNEGNKKAYDYLTCHPKKKYPNELGCAYKIYMLIEGSGVPKDADRAKEICLQLDWCGNLLDEEISDEEFKGKIWSKANELTSQSLLKESQQRMPSQQQEGKRSIFDRLN